MKLVKSISRVLIVILAVFYAVATASVGQWISVVASALITALVTPRKWISRFSTLWIATGCFAIWRMFNSCIHRGVDFIGGVDIYLLSISLSCILILLIRHSWLHFVLWALSVVPVLINAMNASLIFCSKPGVGENVAYLERGKWGTTHTDEKRLDIKSQYSYTMIKACLRAVPIDDLMNLDDFSSLWIITPTQPFKQEEIEKIVQWVHKGGQLVVVSEHTDLFGHAEVLNKLLLPFNIWLGKDCVINEDFSEVAFYSIVGKFNGLTGNTIHGNCWPFLFHFGYREMVDYGGRSFFSDNAATDEDRWGVYCAGAFCSHGRGGVFVFSDSTLFADFALSRPTAQIVLRMLRDRMYIMDIPFMFILFCVVYWAAGGKSLFNKVSTIGTIVFCVGYMILVVSDWNKKADQPLMNGKEEACIRGNWDLIDSQGHKYDVLFSACFAAGVDLPVWNLLPSHNGRLQINGTSVPNLGSGFALQSHDTVEEALTAPLSASVAEFIESLVSSSYRDSMWFDSGAGIFKEYAYKNFWLSLYGKERVDINLGAHYKKRVTGCINGTSMPEITVEIVDVESKDGWVVVGDWMIGKKVGKEILLRKEWQHPSRKYSDVVLTLIQ